MATMHHRDSPCKKGKELLGSSCARQRTEGEVERSVFNGGGRAAFHLSGRHIRETAGALHAASLCFRGESIRPHGCSSSGGRSRGSQLCHSFRRCGAFEDGKRSFGGIRGRVREFRGQWRQSGRGCHHENAEASRAWKARKGYAFRRAQREKEKEQESLCLAESGQIIKGNRQAGFGRAGAEELGRDLLGLGGAGYQRSGANANFEGAEGPQPQEADRENRRFRRKQQFRERFIWRRSCEAEGGRKGLTGLSSDLSIHETSATASCEALREGGRGTVGCDEFVPILTVRHESEAELGEAEDVDASPLRNLRSASDTAQWKNRSSSPSTDVASPKHPSVFAGQRQLEGCMAIDSFGRPTGETEVWWRSPGFGDHSQLCSSYGRSGEEKSHMAARSERGRSGQSKEDKRQRERKETRRRIPRVRREAVSSEPTRKPEGADTLLREIRLQHGSFARYYKIHQGFNLGTGDKTPIMNNGNFALFPSRLPWTSPPGKSRNRRGLNKSCVKEAFEWMHQLWALFNFLDSGSPCSSEAALSSVSRASRGEWTAHHESYARTMFSKLLCYCSHPRGTMERGTAQLQHLIEKIHASPYDSSIQLDAGTSGALEVNPSRVSLPDVAGVLDPAEHLDGKKLEFLCMPETIPTSCVSSADPPACHKVRDEDWEPLLRKLHKAQMITFIPRDQALKEGRKLIRGGLFAVPHKETSDRLINDRRPLNAREKKLGWCQLPAGPMLAQLILEKTESIRASGDDLSNYFYLIKHLEKWQPRNCFGKPIKGVVLRDLGLNPKVTYMATFRVLCMGDQNGVCIAQATHEAVLREAGCLEPQHTLVYGKPFPPHRTLEGLYIDDHLVFQVVNKKGCRDRPPEDDVRLVEASRQRYAELGLPRSEKKAFQKEYCFKAWGTCVDSKSGRVGASMSKLRQIEALTSPIISSGRITKKRSSETDRFVCSSFYASP